MNGDDGFKLTVPATVYDAVVATQGDYFGPMSKTASYKVADDVLSQDKAERQASLLMHHRDLRGARALEVGAGLGTNVITWIRRYDADMFGVEPDGAGFDASFKLARELAIANGVDPERIINATGEHLPFPDHSFDIVFSANVLEHTDDPAKVLRESLRVLRPGGILQFVFPNYCSYYDGHYGVFHPPVLWRGFFPWYVKWICGRDPTFAHTLRTELNVGWVKAQIAQLEHDYAIEVLGLGKDVFLERMTSLDFATWASLGRVKRLLNLVGNAAVRRFLANTIIVLRGWTPIVLTLRKNA
ncbi:MAG: class I SAM-dependent methyltransferase [Dokdonella sp.]